MSNSSDIFQSNNADVTNNVDVWSDTGHNRASRNTGGDVSIDTGNSNVTVDLMTLANLNSARLGGAGNGHSAGGELSLWVVGNGDSSDNFIDADISNSSTVSQDNDADISNDVEVDAQTGDNSARRNTGGEVTIDTGDAKSNVGVANIANFNFADLSCGCLFDDVMAKIGQNGVESDNDIDLDLSDSGKDGVFQGNSADFSTNLDEVESNSGDNNVSSNTAGGVNSDPSVDTGNAVSNTEVVNQANANEAGVGVDFDFDWDWNDIFGSIF